MRFQQLRQSSRFDICSLEQQIFKLSHDVEQYTRLLDIARTEKQELLHRIRNDLASLHSVVERQARRPTEPVASERLNAHVVSLVALYRHLDESAERVSLRAYIQHLASLMPHVTLEETNASEALVDAEQARLTGLVVNEAVTNAVKHAFPHGNIGDIYLRVTSANGRYCVAVSDDGIGYDPHRVALGSGSRLIERIARHLHGDVRTFINALGGTTVVLTFPVGER